MNSDHLAGRLKQFGGKIKERWCKLHDDQIGQVAARRYQIAGRMQALCGIVRQESAQQLKAFKGHHAGYPRSALPMKWPRRLQAQPDPQHLATVTQLTSKNMHAGLAAA